MVVLHELGLAHMSKVWPSSLASATDVASISYLPLGPAKVERQGTASAFKFVLGGRVDFKP